jgi:hypothetical protein
MALRDNVEADVAAELEMNETINVIGARAKQLMLDHDASGLDDLLDQARMAQMGPKYQDKWFGLIQMIEDDIERFQQRERRGK